MKKVRRKLNRIGALALAVVLMGTSIEFPVIAAGNCEHHTEHTEECGYKAAVEGADCTHEHGDECYSKVTDCVHSHDGECGYVEAVEGADCNHSHDENCGENGEECNHEHDDSCGYKEPQEGSECNHECSEESGCIETKENCNHTHDESCGYKAAVEGSPCIFVCDECSSEESGQEDEEENDTCICEDKCTADAVNEECPVCSLEEADLTLCAGEETAVCTCETDDPTYHAPFCDLYELPENPQCFCVEKCTEDSVNEWCDVCYGVGVEGCEGEAPLLSENVMATYASASTPVLYGKRICANGTPITIEEGSSSNTASVWYMDGSTKIYVAENVSDAVIFGGCYNESLDSDTNITMTGGSVYAIYGGGLDNSNSLNGYVNNANINISGGTVTYGVFASNSNWVKGNVNITVTGGNISRVYGCTLAVQASAGNNQEYCKVSGNASVTITGGTVGTLKIGDGQSPVNGTKTGIVTIPGVSLVTNSGFTATNDYDNLYINDGTTFMVKGDVTLPENTKFIIPSGETFTLNGSTTIEAPYGIVNNGTLNIEPGWTTSYNIENNGTLNISTLYTNSEGIVNNGTINLTKPILGNKPTGNGTINRNTAYISGISSVSSISVKMDDADYALANGYYETADGKLYLWLTSGYAVVFVDGSVYCGMANEGTAVELLAYKAVADIETVSSRIPVGVNYNLSIHAVTNNDASYKTIEWSVVNANGTGATITDNAIKATSEGTATIRATVNNGQAYGTAYTKDYEVTFYVTDDIDISLGSITISKKNDTTITVAGTGIPNGSKDYPIDESIRIIGNTTSYTITVESGTTANVILNGVEIDCSNTGITPIMVESGATLNLTLIDNNVLTACTLDDGTDAQKTAALGVPVGAELVITENSTGTLTANGAKGGGAGIGGGYNSGAGTITINGGTINATSDNGAGIGGGYNRSNDKVTRNGGTVTINGGNINATSGKGAGIGGGYYGFGGTVIIKGGTVNATSIGGAGIGGGRYSQNPNNYITVTIEGGTVNATSSEGAGIGGSDQYFSVTVTINGGTINAASTYGAGIGNGHFTGYGNLTVTITGGNFNYSSVTAPTNGTSAVACYTCKFIGNSEDMAGKTVTAITLENGGTYGLKDVVTFDGGSENEGYFNCYLPAGSKITSITVGGTTYNCRAEDGTCYVEHTWEDATCTRAEHCIVCDKTQGETISHNYIDGVCTVCGMDRYGTFHIKTAEQLVAFAQSVNAGNKDANAELDADIDMTGVDWTPICQTVSYHSSEATDTGYTGTFDGNGHTISNLTVTGKSGDTYSYGLFGTVSGTVKNLGMVNYTYTMGSAPDARAGSIAGQVLTGGTITNCYSVGHSITTNSNIAGGIAGCNYGGTISNCYALNGSVSGYDTRWGGVVGDCKKDDSAPDQAQTYGTVSNCYTDDTRVVSSQNDSGSITNCAVKDDAAFASGEITYLLNGSSSGNVTWYQTLGTDTYPVLDSEHDKVYSVFKCNGTEQIYRNVNENEPHTDNNSDGVCDVCGGNAHIHEWTYTANDDTITAVCGADDCPLDGAKTIVISASGKTYDGTAVEATVDNDVDETNYDSEIVYKDNTGAGVIAAIDAGRYTAYLTVGGVTAEVEFTIAPKPITVTADNKSKTYTGNDPELTYAITEGNLVAGDALSGELSRVTGENAGTYAITQGTLTNENNPNYNITFEEGTFTIEQAEATISINETSIVKTYGDAAFNLQAESNNTDNNVVLNYSSSNNDVVSVSADGTVTIKGAGTATITVSLAESANYKAAENKTITVTVGKATRSVEAINKSYLYSSSNPDSINLAELLPPDCGTVNYKAVTPSGNIVYSVIPTVADGILSYTVNPGTANNEGTISVVVETQNYNDITITVNVTLIDQMPVDVKDGYTVELNSNVLTYGDALSELTFKETVFVNDEGIVVEGTLAWKEPSATPDAGTTSAPWVFTPNEAEYAPKEGTVSITVNKAMPNVTAVPTVADRTYNPTEELADIVMTGDTVKGVDGNSLAGSWNWQTANIIPVVNNSGYIAVFTPTDSTNYETVTRTITVNVAKATPHIVNVQGTAITYGDALSASTVSGTAQYSDSDTTSVNGSFSWVDASAKPAVADSNSTEYAVIFTPSDGVNYNTANTMAKLIVNKATNAPNMPGSTMNVSNSYTKIGDVPLPTGWEWQDADKGTPLTVDTPVMATAVYVGVDKENYENTTVTIAVTKNSCDHVAGSILYTGDGEKAPTCTESGLGHKECTKCGTVMESGIVVNALGHTGGSATCKDKAVCARCKQPYGSTDGSKHGDTEVRGYRAATCTSGGYTGDTYCKDCGAKLSSGTSTGAKGHNYVGTVTTEPTTETTGVRTYTCSSCGDSYTEVIPKLPKEEHKHVYTSSVTKEATCTQNGTRTYTCVCGDSYTETIPATDHSYSSEVTTQPTADKEGVMTYTCSACGHTYTDAIAKTGNGENDGTDKEDGNRPAPGAPFIKDDEGEEGWDDIRDEVGDAKDGDTITVDMNGATVVPGDVFNDIKGEDVTVVFDMGNGISWRVNGKDITSDKVGDIDFSVKVGADANNTIPVEIINNVTGERYYMNVSLAYDGEFGFKAVLTLNMDAKNAGLFANLFYFNEQTGELEFVCADEIAEDGTAELTFTHASEYTVVIDKVAMGTVTAPDTSDVSDPLEFGSDDNNSAWWIILLIALLAVAGVAGFVVYSKKKKSE